MNPLTVCESMPLEHVCARLRQLSEHRSPTPPAGPVPVVLAEWALLREAARRLEIMQYDLDTYRRSASNTPADWPHWAVVTDSGKIVATTIDGKQAAETMLTEYRSNTERARSWNVRPMYVGGLVRSHDDERAEALEG